MPRGYHGVPARRGRRVDGCPHGRRPKGRTAPAPPPAASHQRLVGSAALLLRYSPTAPWIDERVPHSLIRDPDLARYPRGAYAVHTRYEPGGPAATPSWRRSRRVEVTRVPRPDRRGSCASSGSRQHAGDAVMRDTPRGVVTGEAPVWRHHGAVSTQPDRREDVNDTQQKRGANGLTVANLRRQSGGGVRRQRVSSAAVPRTVRVAGGGGACGRRRSTAQRRRGPTISVRVAEWGTGSS